MKCNYNLIFNKNKKLNKNGKAAIYIEVYFDRIVRKLINSKIYISPEQWSTSKREINRNKSNYIQLNAFLREEISKIEKYELSLINSGKTLTLDLLNDFLKGKLENQTNFFDFAYSELAMEHIEPITVRRHEIYLKYIQKFKPNLTFSDIDYNYIYELDSYIKNLPGINSLNTVYSYHKSFKKYLNLAINKGLFPMEKNPYLKFKVKQSKTTRENLTETELNQLQDIEYKYNPYLQVILDMFLFSCYTGLRYSDIVNLKFVYFDIVSINNVTLHLPEMQKTKKDVSIPLHLLFNGAALKIFNKYNLVGTGKKLLFNKIANQQINRELKVIAKQAGINKNLTFHMARHTFGTLLANKTGDPYLIKDLMGHSDIKMSMEYIHRSEKVRNDKLKQVKW